MLRNRSKRSNRLKEFDWFIMIGGMSSLIGQQSNLCCATHFSGLFICPILLRDRALYLLYFTYRYRLSFLAQSYESFFRKNFIKTFLHLTSEAVARMVPWLSSMNFQFLFCNMNSSLFALTTRRYLYCGFMRRINTIQW